MRGRGSFTTDDELALAASILFSAEDGLPAFVHATLKIPGLLCPIPLWKAWDGTPAVCMIKDGNSDPLQIIMTPLPIHLFDSISLSRRIFSVSKACAWPSDRCLASHAGRANRDGHAKAREAVYKWLEGFLLALSPERAAQYGGAAINEVAIPGFKRETDNYCRAASLAPVQAALERRAPPWSSDGCGYHLLQLTLAP